MNHETTIKRIQELVPDVMKKEVGCILQKEIKGKKVNGILLENTTGSFEDGGDILGVVYWFTGRKTAVRELVPACEILGKPITLVVVLLAIEKKNKARLELTVTEWEDVLGFWNLSKDNFNDQSDETKEFIGGLLN